MTVQTTSTGEIVPRAKAQAAAVSAAGSLEALLARMAPEVARAVPSHCKPDRMMRIFLTALRTVPHLATCEPKSFLAAIVQAAQLGLEPNTPLGHAYLIPRRNRKLAAASRGKFERECTLLIGYKGHLDLAYRSGDVAQIQADVVKAGDFFEFEKGLSPILRHKPGDAPDRSKREVLYAYCIVRLVSGVSFFEVLPRAEIEARRARSSSPNDGPWVTDYEAMAKKSAWLALQNWVPKASEGSARMAVAANVDDSARSITAVADPEVLGILQRSGFEIEEIPEEEPVEQAAAQQPAAAEPVSEAVVVEDTAKAEVAEAQAEAPAEPRPPARVSRRDRALFALEGAHVDPTTGEIVG